MIFYNFVRIYSQKNQLPVNKNEQQQQHHERNHVVHGFHENHHLALQSRQEPHQLENPQQPESSQNRKALKAVRAGDLDDAD